MESRGLCQERLMRTLTSPPTALHSPPTGLQSSPTVPQSPSTVLHVSPTATHSGSPALQIPSSTSQNGSSAMHHRKNVLQSCRTIARFSPLEPLSVPPASRSALTLLHCVASARIESPMETLCCATIKERSRSLWQITVLALQEGLRPAR